MKATVSRFRGKVDGNYQQTNGGGEHPAVEDFLRASLRELRKVERAAEQAPRDDDGVKRSSRDV